MKIWIFISRQPIEIINSMICSISCVSINDNIFSFFLRFDVYEKIELNHLWFCMNVIIYYCDIKHIRISFIYFVYYINWIFKQIVANNYYWCLRGIIFYFFLNTRIIKIQLIIIICNINFYLSVHLHLNRHVDESSIWPFARIMVDQIYFMAIVIAKVATSLNHWCNSLWLT